MFALEDLSFDRSRACPDGGYTNVGGRYTKRHMLLSQVSFDVNAGDPIFYSTSLFEWMHKEKMHPAFHHSSKHAATVPTEVLLKVRACPGYYSGLISKWRVP